jgi:hypothetical protein
LSEVGHVSCTTQLRLQADSLFSVCVLSTLFTVQTMTRSSCRFWFDPLTEMLRLRAYLHPFLISSQSSRGSETTVLYYICSKQFAVEPSSRPGAKILKAKGRTTLHTKMASGSRSANFIPAFPSESPVEHESCRLCVGTVLHSARHLGSRCLGTVAEVRATTLCRSPL